MRQGKKSRWRFLFPAFLFVAGSHAHAETCSLAGSTFKMHSSYTRAAAATGGNVVTMDPRDLANPDFIKFANTHYNEDTIAGSEHNAQGDLLFLYGINPSDRPVSVPVDDTIRELVFKVSAAGPLSLDVTDASGKEVNNDYTGSDFAHLTSACLVKISNPHPGKWHVLLSGKDSSTASVLVFAKTRAWLMDAEFKRMVMGDEGPMMVPLIPKLKRGQQATKEWIDLYRSLPGTKQSLEITVIDEGDGGDISGFEVRSEKGKVLAALPVDAVCPLDKSAGYRLSEKPVACRQESADAFITFFIRGLNVPFGTSYVYAIGNDKEGNMLVRGKTLYFSDSRQQ